MKGFLLRTRVRDVAISLVAITALLALLALIDERVREQGARLAGGDVAGGVATAGARAGSAGATFLSAVRDLEMEQMSLALFVVIATALVIAMLRT